MKKLNIKIKKYIKYIEKKLILKYKNIKKR